MKKKILAIDDDPVIREIIEVMLTAEGFEVEVCESGNTALDRIKSLGGSKGVALILLDKQMPGMTGFEVLSKLREDDSTSKTPVIMLTAEDKPEDIMTGYSVGADYYITKPFTREQLAYGIRLVLGK